MTELSPAAQEVVNAAVGVTEYGKETPLLCARIAVALRAAADQVIPVTKSPWGSTLVPVLSSQESRDRLFAIADELERANG